ncbi:MAG TPA: gliding motility-associated C-terminal domain-containing protein, partial [Cyclobacteriaceae bacterium]|nr:gliding motility-associated C-terminal domain-containing protein [Cyclobacteriaceae bacterium]
RPFNSFLNQAPYTNSYGCPQYAAPNLTYLAGSLVINAPTCPDKDFTVSLTIKNLGNKNITGSVPISFYNRNPFKTGATLYNTVKVSLANLIPGATFTTSSLTVKGNGSADSLWIVLNDAGTTLPTPIKLPNTAFIECDYNNGIPAYVTPTPVPMTAITTDDLQCNGTLPHTGTATAKVVINSVDRSSEFDFYWSDGTTAKPIPADFKGKTYTQRAAGTYTVFGVHKLASCGTTTVQAVVKQSPAKDPQVDVYVVQDDNNCSVPNGILRAVVNDPDKDGVGDPASKFTFAWYKTSEFLTGTIVSTSDSARVLLPVPYTVLVTDKTTGCFNNGTPKTVGDARPKMKVSIVPTPINCSALPTGTLTATLTVNGATVSNPAGYQFNWYNGKKVKPGTPDYSTQNLSGLSANSYTLFVFDQSGTQCVSDTVTSTVTKTLPPVILSTKATHKQTSCQVGVSNGSAEVVVDDITKYTYQWFNGQNTQAANKIPGATSSTVAGLAKGIYTIQITEISTNCSSTAEVTIDEDTAPIVITPSAISNSSCSPKTGSVTINGVPASGSVLSDYTFFLDNGKTTVQQTGNNVFSNLDQGTYNVWAFNDVTKCQTTVKQQPVLNTIPVVSSTPSVVQAAADCKNGLGTLSVSSSGSANNFRFDWYKGGDTTGVSLFFETGTSSTFITKYGNYSIKIEDLSNHCKTMVQQFLPVANSHSLSTAPTDLDKCAPLLGGSVDATLTITTTVPAVTYTQADYVIDIYKASDDPDALDTGSPLPMNTITPAGATVTQTYTLANVYDEGFYTFVATCRKPGSPTDGCRVSSTVNLRRITTNPVINNTVVDNVKCAPKDGGEIDLVLGVNPGVDDDPNLYDFTWSNGAVTSNVTGLAPNTYTVTATFKPTVKNGGCSSTKTIPVLDVPQLIALPPLTPTAVTHCAPANGLTPNAEGAAAITQLTVNGSTVNAPFPVAYTFAWSNGATTNSVSGLLPNTYNVVVTNTTTGCTQNADVTIEDQTINTVGVDLVKFRNEVHCVDPQKGMFRVAGTTPGTNTNGYSYSWYNGASPTLTGPPDYAVTLDSLNNLSFNQTITVKVENLDNNCWAVGTYTLGETIIPIRISANSTPITQCDNILVGTAEDGSLYSTVILPTTRRSGPVDPKTDFTYIWEFNGVDKYTNQQEVKNLKLTDVQGAVIKVRAVDNFDADARCVSDIVQVFIENAQTFPAVAATALLPVTNCNLIPNGSAAASVNGDILNYSFEWYEDAITPSSTSFHLGPDVDSLKAFLSPDNTFYTVLATNIFTGCTNSDTLHIKYVPGKLQDPNVTVLADQTSCDLTNPNGSLGADIGGNTAAYEFTWTKVGDAAFGSKKQPVITDLIDCSNCYNVVAVDTATGCQSSKNGSIVFKPVYPDFNLAIIDATCNNDDGFAAVYIINEDPINIKSIEWFIDGNLVISGNAAYNAVASDNYKVVVTTDMGCTAEKTFSIRPEVHPHNGISRNNDDLNTHFHIDCIDNYPGNIVRIYNRIGTLVYEAKDYNNFDVSFDGKSNKGVSVMGTNLPDGTYFYIIDKRNGSKQLAGYLEIVN